MRQEALERSNNMGTNRNEYIHNVAHTVIGQIGGVPYDYGNYYSSADEANYPNVLWQRYGDKVFKVVEKMGPAARGRIITCGVGSSTNGCLAYHEVNEGLINPGVAGDELLMLLASYGVVAAIVDIIREGVEHMRDEEQREDDELNRGMAAYMHRVPSYMGGPR